MKLFLFPVLFLMLGHTLSAQQVNYNPATGQFSIDSLKPPKSTGVGEYKGKPGFWGIYFWDFGDGTYYLYEREKPEEKVIFPVHKYAMAKPYTATVYLTPFYSFEKARRLTRLIPTPVKGKPESEDEMEGCLVNIQTSTSNRIIPGHEARIAVHYEAPADGAGTLLLFYGKNTGLKTKIDHPAKFYEESNYYNEMKYNGVVSTFIQTKLQGDAVSAATQLMTGSTRYPDVAAFNIPPMKKGEQRRLFLTMRSSEKLENARTSHVNIYVAALWVPAGVPFKRATMLREMKFSLPPVHDPNNIVGPRRMYYRKGQPKELEYEVNFLNVGKGVVRDVKVTIPTRGIQPQSIRLIPGLMEPPCKECPTSNFRDSVCWQKKVYPDSVVMNLYNIGLQPKKGLFNKKYSKGAFSFYINSDGRFRPRSKVNAKIDFLGGEQVVTRHAVTQWRHRALYLEPGYSFGLNKSAVPDQADTVGRKGLRPLSFALGFQNASLGCGLLWGWEAGISQQHFFQDTILPVTNENVTFPEAMIKQSEVFNILYLDAKAIVGYQLNPFVRASGGLGFALPLKARMDVVSTLTSLQTPPVTSRNTIRYGLLENRDKGAFVFNQPLENRPSPGISAQWGFEAGAMNTISLGFEHQLRFFPNFYKKGCATLSNINVYVRFKLIPLVSKSL